MKFNELYPKKKEYYYLLMGIKTTAECNVSNCVIDKQKAKLLMRYINKKEKEIERLNEKIDTLKIEISSLMSRYFYEEDFYIEDTHLDKLLRIIDNDIVLRGSDKE